MKLSSVGLWTSALAIACASIVVAAADNSLLGGGLLGGGGLLEAPAANTTAPAAGAAKAPAAKTEGDAASAHLALFAESRYPSANTCKTCHPVHYEQWSVSQHAYAQLSPIFLAMQNAINAGTSSTNGDFCIRCHTQVGMNIGESPFMSNLDRHPTSREGITCVICHRLTQEYGKVSGRVALAEGDLLTPVYGPKGNAELKRVLENRQEFKVVTEKESSGRKIHADVGHFPFLSKSAFCGTCHDVNLFNGFRLEEAFSDFKRSPASSEGTTCQDCHMGKVAGKVSGYDEGPAAEVGGVPTRPRKLTGHFFAGPDYSVVHPGIFPHNDDAAKMATLREWLQFDHKAGWGTEKFEDAVPKGFVFPMRWRSVDDRYDAAKIIAYQLKRLDYAREQRLVVLRNGYGLGEIEVVKSGADGLEFRVAVKNMMNGHSVPTGFDAERMVWLEVTVTDAANKVVYKSGDLDPNGDVRDLHSTYVRNGDLPLDSDLFGLQSKFITLNARGGEREQVLAVNYSVDPLPFIRPSTTSTILTGQPAGARKHRYVIPPLAQRIASYRVKSNLFTGAGTYQVRVRLKAAMVPVNLVTEIQFVGFDYGMSPREIADAVVAGHQVLVEKTSTVKVAN
ncbi:MAG: multiheme c-type cytochrome [Burkholderiaceae bacterium]